MQFNSNLCDKRVFPEALKVTFQQATQALKQRHEDGIEPEIPNTIVKYRQGHGHLLKTQNNITTEDITTHQLEDLFP